MTPNIPMYTDFHERYHQEPQTAVSEFVYKINIFIYLSNQDEIRTPVLSGVFSFQIYLGSTSPPEASEGDSPNHCFLSQYS